MGMIFTTFTLYIIPSMYLVIEKTDRIDAVEVELKKQIKI